MKKKYSRNIFSINLLLGASLMFITSCTKVDDGIGSDPYGGGKPPLGIKFTGALPTPQSGLAGSEAIFYATGLKAYKDTFSFFINGELAQVLQVGDSTVRVKIPDNVSSGNASIQTNGQVFFGPRFTVLGNVAIDDGFGVTSGANGPVYSAVDIGNNGYFLAGLFTTFQGSGTVDIAQITKQGVYSTVLAPVLGANGPLYSAGNFTSGTQNGKYIVAGNFSTYNKRGDIGNITRLKSNGAIDDTVVSVVNVNPANTLNGLDTVPLFNGGSQDGSIIKTFVTTDNKVIAVGNFHYHSSIIYSSSTRTTRQYKVTPINNIMRMEVNGKLDSTFNFSATASKIGANDDVNDAIQQPDGKIILVGNFTNFNGNTVNGIVRLDATGTPDATFTTGTGANGPINTITYNATQNKYVLTGTFSSFNGAPANGVVVLNSNGTIYSTFALGLVTGGNVNFAAMLNNGRVIVSGTFKKYNNVTRNGFLVLNNDGTASQAANVPGTFEGQIYQIIEATSSYGNPALLMIGNIRRFDDRTVGNIIRVEIKN